MGNAISATTGESLVTASMARYMTLTQEQAIAIRNELLPMAVKRRGSIKRGNFHFALQQADLAENPDQEVLDLLFTMWDMTGSGRVAGVEFVIGMSVLACKDESIEEAIRFALEIADGNNTGKISSKDSIALLRSVCATATYFGDRPLALRQIYKIVDCMFRATSVLTHDEFVKLLCEQQAVQDVVCVSGQKPRKPSKPRNVPSTVKKIETLKATAKPAACPPEAKNSVVEPVKLKTALDKLQEKFQQDENFGEACSNSLLENSLVTGPSEDSDDKSEPVETTYSTDFSSHMSTMKLTPLTKITISSNTTSPVVPRQADLQLIEPIVEKSIMQGLSIPWMKSKPVKQTKNSV